MSATEETAWRIIRRGYAAADPEHIGDVRQQSIVEQDWLMLESRFAGNEDVEEAVRRGELYHITDTKNYRPIARFLDTKNHRRGFQPYLKPEALSILGVLGETWRELADRQGVRPDAKLAVTSMVRSMQYQYYLNQEPGKLALRPLESSHPTGWAFDIDSSGYYLHPAGETPVSVSWRDGREQERLGRALGKGLGEIASPTVIGGPMDYEVGAMSSLHQATNLLYNAGLINRIVEFPGTEHECLHICVNPEVFRNSKTTI